ncbi:hypothetical protein [Altericroceibacterium xinjiangense]|uniref:hypothetical protein n=1 Tax=Altericroceibacterium xinjiangense TaxID=762261 RepID=UPI000F7E8166|nr:hypothetical protein [Altericroceibacterium xinjiangense]
MAKKPSALAGIFDDDPETAPTPAQVSTPVQESEAQMKRAPASNPRQLAGTAPARRSSHPGKKPVLIHIPEDMHRTLRQLSVEEGGEPLTVITERLLRQYLVTRGHTKFAP